MRPTANVTSQDVADKAGVSRRVVSLVLNRRGQGEVSEATRRRVEEAAAELHYRRSAVALSLQRQRTLTVGLITDQIASRSAAGQLIKGAAEEALGHGYMLLTLDLGHDGVDLPGSVRLLEERKVDGAIFATASRSITDFDVRASMPLVFANSAPSVGQTVPSFIPDDEGGARHAIARLARSGHRRVTMLSGDGTALAEVERERGAIAESVERGIELDVVRSGWHMRDGYLAAHRILQSPSRPSALFCIRDRVAGGALHAAAALGIRVPEDLSVIGFDDEEGFASMLVPALTTVELPLAEMGRLAMRALVGRIESADDAKTFAAAVILPCVLVERGSVAAA